MTQVGRDELSTLGSLCHDLLGAWRAQKEPIAHALGPWPASAGHLPLCKPKACEPVFIDTNDSLFRSVRFEMFCLEQNVKEIRIAGVLTKDVLEKSKKDARLFGMEIKFYKNEILILDTEPET